MKSRWVITATSAAIFFGGSFRTSLGDPWFQNLARPNWLTFEFLIPFIWLFIWVCATISAILVWEKLPRDNRPWLLMILYALIGVLTAIYSPVVVALKSLPGGLVVGATASLLVYILAILVKPILPKAALLLIPYMLWGPIGTYLTWVLIKLNPQSLQ
ncbi:MAG TPA: TspO/MBR family protein [Oculatellaceae cyanobacterium]|jgi:tryptophan-rich sensory protein